MLSGASFPGLTRYKNLTPFQLNSEAMGQLSVIFGLAVALPNDLFETLDGVVCDPKRGVNETLPETLGKCLKVYRLQCLTVSWFDPHTNARAGLTS
jgi:hypothetical protein